MWRATVYAATLAVALVGASSADVAAQGKGQGRGQASERFEERGKKGKEQEKAEKGRSQGGLTARSADDIRREQARQQAERDRARRDRDRYDDDRYDDDRYDRNGSVYGQQQAKSGSPSFCRSGAGHPTKGRQWCIQKGFGLGNDRWGRARWEDVVFDRRTTQNGRVSGSVLQDVLGRVIYGRLVNQSRLLGGGSLYGNWLNTGDSRVLQVQAGARPLAEFIDQNYDGRADVILLNLGR